MTRMLKWSKRCTAILAAGMVFQAGGCAISSQELAITLFSTILQNLVGQFVFSSFNLIP